MGGNPTADRLTRGVLSRRSGDRDLVEAHAYPSRLMNADRRVAKDVVGCRAIFVAGWYAMTPGCHIACEE
ncbi:hypothetical protein BDK92_3574 [Micromonospora pisi]|uniref:Uncharacterized protein n=1 Tax=Micromonospora pisi TaxID=589240 RepID=A0A495JLM3_9ACTN|nr:hypothetical protein BDK92_3574 [Micromonospora pisi]